MSLPQRVTQSRAVTITDSGGVTYGKGLKHGTNAGEVAITGAAGWPCGVALDSQETQNEPVEMAVGPCTVVAIAGAAIPRLTGGKPTRVVCAASGKFTFKPTSGGGTTVVVGEVDVDQGDVAADGDEFLLRLYSEPREETIPT